jgi:4-amino-4-deoxy-L-arabinose transferase-like glycosyltransferase
MHTLPTGPEDMQEIAQLPRARGFLAFYIVFALIGCASVAAALLLAFGGFTWGLPGPDHIQSYHPDEQNVTLSLRNMHPENRDFNPHFWGNPTFYTYQVGALALAAAKLHILPGRLDSAYWLAHPEAVRTFYILGRELSFAYMVLSAVLVFYVTRRLTADKFAPLVAAAIFISLPVTAVHCHYMTVNSAAVFWSLAAMLVTLRILDKPTWVSYIFAGLFAGLAIATKLSNAFLPLAILTAHVVASAPLGWKRLLLPGRLVAAAVMCGLGFFAGSPYYVLAHNEVIADAHHNMNMAALFDFTTPPDVMLGDFWNHWSAACGWVLGAVFFAALPVAFVFGPRRRLAPVFAVVFPLLLLAVKSGWWAFPSRIWPLLALLSIVTAVMLFERRRAIAAGLLAPSLALGLLITIPWNIAYFNLTRYPHVREESSQWIEANIRPEAGIIILDTPYFESPDVIYRDAVHPEAAGGPRFKIVNLEGDFAALKSAPGKWLVIPERYDGKLREKLKVGMNDYARRNGFGLVTTFDRDFEAFGYALRSWIPADMVQNYAVYIFRRNEPVPAAASPAPAAAPAAPGEAHPVTARPFERGEAP